MTALLMLHAASACTTFLNPMDYAVLNRISICAGNLQVQQDPSQTQMLLPNQQQTLPLDYVSGWPIWVVAPADSKLPVVRVPGPMEGAEFGKTWVPPACFEQLWLPDDLPTPRARAAIGLVLRNGEPRYLFPTIDTVLEIDGVTWRNRGLNSVPLGRTWMHFGELPPEQLRLSVQTVPPRESADEDVDKQAASVRTWQPCMDAQPVHQAIDAAFEALNALPPALQRTSLGDGFAFLISPLPSAGEGAAHGASEGGSVLLPESALAPGGRLRVLLSEESDGGDEGGLASWQRAECDLSMWKLPPGKESPYMMEVYAPLYEHDYGAE